MLKPYNKQAIIAAMRRRELLLGAATKAPSFWDVSKWPQWWEAGAKEIEKSAPGRIITAPIRLPEAVVTSTKKTVEEVPRVVKSVSMVVPFVALAAAVLGSAYIVYRFKEDKKEKKLLISRCN
jgi:hypothetical protein